MMKIKKMMGKIKKMMGLKGDYSSAIPSFINKDAKMFSNTMIQTKSLNE